jgi:hypothetical protein
LKREETCSDGLERAQVGITTAKSQLANVHATFKKYIDNIPTKLGKLAGLMFNEVHKVLFVLFVCSVLPFPMHIDSSPPSQIVCENLQCDADEKKRSSQQEEQSGARSLTGLRQLRCGTS